MAHHSSSVDMGLKWRSSTFFIFATVAVGCFTDMFLYGIIVPVLPFMLKDRVNVPDSEIQSTISYLLAIYAAASVLASPIVGVLSDKFPSSRQIPFLFGLIFLLLSTVLLAVGTSVPVLALARFLQGAAGGTVWTIGMVLLVESVGQENLGKTTGTVFSFSAVAGLISPVVGGLLYSKTGYAGVFGVGVALIIVDFIMRILMVEKKAADSTTAQDSSSGSGPQSSGGNDPSESTPLIPNTAKRTSLARYRLSEPTKRITKAFPIILVMRDPGLLTVWFMSFVSAALLGAFDATVSLVSSETFGFDSLKAGALYFALGGADLPLGPVFGWCVDHLGTKPIAVGGYIWFVPALALLRLPIEDLTYLPTTNRIVFYVFLLALNGIGFSIIGAPSVVESGIIIEKYFKANERIFKGQAPYAQLYGINSMLWSFGLTMGPLIAGGLREQIGYGNMNAVLAGVCGFTAILCVLFIGRKDEEDVGNYGNPGDISSADEA